jgi:hypothetical protein
MLAIAIDSYILIIFSYLEMPQLIERIPFSGQVCSCQANNFNTKRIEKLL